MDKKIIVISLLLCFTLTGCSSLMEVLSQGTLGNDNIYDAMYEVGLENGEDALWSEEWDEDEAENEVMFESWSSQEAYMQGYRDARD